MNEGVWFNALDKTRIRSNSAIYRDLVSALSPQPASSQSAFEKRGQRSNLVLQRLHNRPKIKGCYQQDCIDINQSRLFLVSISSFKPTVIMSIHSMSHSYHGRLTNVLPIIYTRWIPSDYGEVENESISIIEPIVYLRNWSKVYQYKVQTSISVITLILDPYHIMGIIALHKAPLIGESLIEILYGLMSCDYNVVGFSIKLFLAIS